VVEKGSFFYMATFVVPPQGLYTYHVKFEFWWKWNFERGTLVNGVSNTPK